MPCSEVPCKTADMGLPVAMERQGEQPRQFSQDLVAVASWVPHGSPRPTATPGLTQHLRQTVHQPTLLPPVQSRRGHLDSGEEVAEGGV